MMAGMLDDQFDPGLAGVLTYSDGGAGPLGCPAPGRHLPPSRNCRTGAAS